MPWWNRELWSLRHDLRTAYTNRYLLRSPEAELEYRLIKSKYQQALRYHKRASWKDFCSANFNGDIFGALKKNTPTTSFQWPSPKTELSWICFQLSEPNYAVSRRQLLPKTIYHIASTLLVRIRSL
jgi:hypothetical protein